jgi:hypothetical protein
MLLLAAAAAPLSRHPSSAAVFGVASFLAGAAMLWVGRDAKRAALPGALAGLAPLVLTLCAGHVGHACMGDGCMMLCVPACVAGGGVAGFAVAMIARRRGAGIVFWTVASAMALVTGAVGCSCAGVSGLVGLLAGYAVGAAPILASRVLVRPSS